MNKSGRSERVGWYLYDWANSAFYTTIVTVFLGPYLTSIVKSAADPGGFVYLWGLKIFADSFFPYVVSFSVLMQVLILPAIGAYTDYTKAKKYFLIVLAFIGSFSAMGLYFLEGTNFLLGGGLFILANVSFGASVVVYNSFLNEIAEPKDRDSVSSIGWALGYLGGGISLALNLLIYSNAEKLGLTSSEAIRICLFSAGAWWAVFTIAPMLTLKVRKAEKKLDSNVNLLTIGFKQFFRTIRESRHYPGTLLFLLAYLLYNDGVQTVIVMSSLFGQEELKLSLGTLTTIILMVQFVAFFGAIVFNYISKISSNKAAILLSLVLWICCILYAYLFLKTEAEFYVLAAVIGIVLGGTQALSRSLFSLLIPKGKEAEYFSIYEISERGTSWLGPMLFGLALQLTSSYRIALFSLGIFFIGGFVILYFTNINKAILLVGNKA